MTNAQCAVILATMEIRDINNIPIIDIHSHIDFYLELLDYADSQISE